MAISHQGSYKSAIPTFPSIDSIIGDLGLTAEFGMGSGVTPGLFGHRQRADRPLGRSDH